MCVLLSVVQSPRQPLWLDLSVSGNVLNRPCRLTCASSPSSALVCCAEGHPGKGFGRKKVEVPKTGKQRQSDGSGKGSGLYGAANTSSESSKALKNILEISDRERSDERSKRLNIDPLEASNGKVDFVRVQSWAGGNGQAEPELENLKLKSFSPAFQASGYDAPLYEQLVRRLQLLESKGDLAVAEGRVVPEFGRWVFGENRYLQFLVDQRAVFQSLKHTIEELEKSYISDGREKGDYCKRAVLLFGEHLGLDRFQALCNDINKFCKTLTKKSESPSPTTQTIAYTKYIQSIGKSCLSGGTQGKRACLHLFAHIFVNYVTHLTTGIRVGAKAVDNLPILGITKGVSFYREYPAHVQDPLKLFVSTINKGGNLISSADDIEQVMEELPKAFQKASLLLSVLAVEEISLS